MSFSHDYVDDSRNTPKKEDLINSALADDELLAEAADEESLRDEEAAKLVTDVATTLWAELEESEENALDVTTAVDQIIKLSDRDQYRKAMDTIFGDPSLSTEEKLRLKAEEDERQDQKDERATQRVTRLQTSQSNVVENILKSYGIAIGLGAGGVSIVLLCGTGTGRAILNKVANWIVKEAPRLVQQAVA